MTSPAHELPPAAPEANLEEHAARHGGTTRASVVARLA